MAAAREIIIPVNHQNLGVAVSLDALPDDENDLLQILQAEQAPLRLWLDFAKAYLQQGREEQGRRMLEDGCSDGACLRQPFRKQLWLWVAAKQRQFSRQHSARRCKCRFDRRCGQHGNEGRCSGH